MAEDLFKHYRSDITSLELVPSSGGAFEVFSGEEKIFSKLETGRYPEIDEIVSKINK